MRYFSILTLLAAISFTGCTVGPNYRRPPVQIPGTFRAPDPLPPQTAASLADLKWFEVFKDEKLQELIRTALEQNYDLREAVTRVEQARANLGIVRSEQFPTVAAGAEIQTNRTSRNAALPLSPAFLPNQNRTFGQATLQLLSFEVDIWGRLRRATEASRARLLESDETRKAVVTTLVSQVATSYFTLRELDDQLEIARRTLKVREDSLDLIRQRQAGGVATLLDLRQAEQLVYSARETIPSVEQQIGQMENRISLLLGKNPGPVIRGQSLIDQQMPPDVPAGLTSALLERRPDIRAAEQSLVAANAEIGVAKAAYFPQISLTGFLGGQSNQLSGLFAAENRAWNFTPQIAQPLFTGGRLKSNVRLTEALQRGAVVDYERSIQTAFAEVSDSLIAHQRLRESRVQQELLVGALQDRTRLAYIRYRGGVDTLLNALDADRDLFNAELDLSGIRLDELLSVVQFYKALGGGWQ